MRRRLVYLCAFFFSTKFTLQLADSHVVVFRGRPDVTHLFLCNRQMQRRPKMRRMLQKKEKIMMVSTCHTSVSLRRDNPWEIRGM